MAFNCKNIPDATDCLNYVGAYIVNYKYVSEKLLDIINSHILANPEDSVTPVDSGSPVDLVPPVDITDDLCVCLPLCSNVVDSTEECVGEYVGDVFSCITWGQIKDKLINVSEEGAAEGTPGILPLLCQTIRCSLNNTPDINHGFAAQLERFLCLVESLATRLDSVCCNNKCPELIGDLLCLLMQILTRLISSVSKAAVLIQYSNPDEIKCTTGQGNLISTFFECMVCDFVNDLYELEKLIPELSSIVVGFATCDKQMCTPCYTAPKTPRKVRPACPTNPAFNQCGCSCNM